MKLDSDSSPVLGRKRHPLVRCVSSYAIGAIVSVTAVSIVAYSYGLLVRGSRRLYVGWFSSAGFVLLTVSISLRLIILHLINWNAPHIQKYVVRIVWMVPIYAAESWMALRFKNSAVYIESMRESYESYAIFSFLHFLIALLGEEHQLVSKLKLKTADRGAHAWPISELLSPWAMGHDLLQNCKFGVFQYVIIKNIFAVLICASAGSDWYREGHFRLDGLYLYQCLICNISQLWALYCLVLFYFATKEELSPWRPHGKFLSVKSVVFFTWWQSVLINALAKPAWTSDGEWTSQQVSKGVQDYAICLEMFVASIVFSYTFTHKDYLSFSKSRSRSKDYDDEGGSASDERLLPSSEVKPFFAAFWQSSIPDEVVADLRRMVFGNTIVRRLVWSSVVRHWSGCSEEEEQGSSSSVAVEDSRCRQRHDEDCADYSCDES